MDKGWPKISIVTPNYNLGAFLEHTITSVLNQNYPNLEYIIIDGGSTDNSLEIIDKYKEHLHYYVSEPDGGMYDAIQKGMDQSSGDILTYLNSDDILLPDSLKSIARIFTDLPQIEWVQGSSVVVNEAGHIVSVGHTNRSSIFDYMKPDMRWIGQAGTFWKRSLWNRAGRFVDKNLKLAGDFELWNRFFDHGKLYTAENLLSGFRFRAGQLHGEFDNYMKEVNTVLSKKEYSESLLKQQKNKQKKYNLIRRIPGFRNTEFARKLMDDILESSPLISWDKTSCKYFLSNK